MTIKTYEDKIILKNAGFTDWEISQFDVAADPKGDPQPDIDLNSPVWQRVLESRRHWIEDKIKRGWTEADINNNIMGFYHRRPKADPFVFLKAEYRPPVKKDFYENISRREQRMIKTSLPGYYRK